LPLLGGAKAAFRESARPIREGSLGLMISSYIVASKVGAERRIADLVRDMPADFSSFIEEQFTMSPSSSVRDTAMTVCRCWFLDRPRS